MLRPLICKFRRRLLNIVDDTFYCPLRHVSDEQTTRTSEYPGVKCNLKRSSIINENLTHILEGHIRVQKPAEFSERCYFHRDYSTEICSDKKDGVCIDKPTKWPNDKRANFKFHEETEDILNKQINAELKAFYYYLSMAAYFGRADVALPGCESFFMQMHHEEHEHALRFFNYVKMRGGRVNLCPVSSPDDQDWKCPLNAFKTALDLEIEVTEKLVAVNAVAEKHGDLNASDFIITEFMEDQMKSVNEMGRFVAVLSGIGDQTLARFLFDKDLLDNHVLPRFNVLKTKLPGSKSIT